MIIRSVTSSYIVSHHHTISLYHSSGHHKLHCSQDGGPTGKVGRRRRRKRRRRRRRRRRKQDHSYLMIL
jgi:hypothetical protein